MSGNARHKTMTTRFRWVVPILVATAMFASAAPVFALTQGSCPANDTSKVLLYENKVGGGVVGSGDDRLWVCGNTSSLWYIPTESSGCEGAFSPQSNWNDCVSSLQAWIPSGYHLELYDDASYQHRFQCLAFFSGQAINLTHNDSLTSFRWLSGTCP
jgi:hypothetical protein